MTLDASRSAAAAEAPPLPDDSSRPSEARDEGIELSLLADLLADTSAVSSEEAGPAGFAAASLLPEEAAADGESPVESLAGESPSFATADVPAPDLHTGLASPDVPDDRTSADPGDAADPPAVSSGFEGGISNATPFHEADATHSESSSLPDPATPGIDPALAGPGGDETAAAPTAEHGGGAASASTGAGAGAETAGVLSEPGAAPPSREDTGLDDPLLRRIADAGTVSSGGAAEAPDRLPREADDAPARTLSAAPPSPEGDLSDEWRAEDAGDDALRGPADPDVQTDSTGDERRDERDETRGGRPDRDADTGATAAVIDETLLQSIAEAPSVSSDPTSPDRADAADRAAETPVHDARSETGERSPSDRESAIDTTESRGPGSCGAADSLEDASGQPETPGPEASRFIGQADLHEATDAFPAGVSAGSDVATADDDARSVIHLPDPSGAAQSGTPLSEADAGDDDLPLQQFSGAVSGTCDVAAGSADPDSSGVGDTPARSSASVPQPDELSEADSVHSSDAEAIRLPGPEEAEARAGRAAPEHLDERDGAPAKASLPGAAAGPAAESPMNRRDPAEAGVAPAVEGGSGSEDTPARDDAPSVIRLPDLSSRPPGDTDRRSDDALLRQIAEVVNASSGETAGSPVHPGAHDASAQGRSGAAERVEEDESGEAHAEDAGVIALPGPAYPEVPADSSGDERRDQRDETRGVLADRDAKSSIATAAPIDATLLQNIAEAPSISSESISPDRADASAGAAEIPVRDTRPEIDIRPETGTDAPSGTEPASDPVESHDSDVPTSDGGPAPDSSAAPETAADAAADDADPEGTGVIALPDPTEPAVRVDSAESESSDGSGEGAPDRAGEGGTGGAATGIVFDDSLLLDIAEVHLGEVPSVSSGEDDAPQVLGQGADSAADLDPSPATDSEPAFDISLPDAGAAPPRAAGTDPDPEYADIPLEASSPGPAAALAFATDAETEVALRDGLFGFGSAPAGMGEPQVWQGGLRAAIAALGEGRSAPLVIVDIDGVPYPAGAIHELAAVCEVGTVVIAVGSDVTARPGRELLLAGVSDYLAKPLTAETVHGVAARAVADTEVSPAGGCVAGFVGCGGSGATTLAAATALHAAERGCYVSVLDLSRSVAALALALGVDPVAGLDQLLETADKVAVDPESLEGVCARRSDRIEVYAHRWSPEHPVAASASAVDRLVASLRQRSQVVLVDGLDEAGTRFSHPAGIDTRIFVAEPTAGKTPHLARMVDLLESDRPSVLVQNHTRAFRRDAGARALRDAGIGIGPAVVIPFDPAVPETSDRGWPQGRLPRSLRKPVAALTDRLLGSSSGAGAAALAAVRGA